MISIFKFQLITNYAILPNESKYLRQSWAQFQTPHPPFAWDCNILENSNWKCANTHYLNLPKGEFIQCNWFINWLWNYYMLKLTNNIFFWDFNLFYQFSWSQKKTSTNYWCRNLVIHDLVGSLWSKTTPQNFLAFKRGEII